MQIARPKDLEMAALQQRKFIVGGNWKSNGTMESVTSLVEILNAATIPDNVDIVVCPMAIHIPFVQSNLKTMKVGAQDCSLNNAGAFTGEISAGALKDFSIDWVITGHSERRAAGESSDVMATKTKLALDHGLSVMACVGETLEVREAGRTMEVVLEDHMSALKAVLEESDWLNLCIAYEPVWAIGTGLTASPEQAQEVHSNIRNWIKENISDGVANSVRIMYGGSVKGANAPTLAACADVDGFLVGGAALSAEFAKIIDAAGSAN